MRSTSPLGRSLDSSYRRDASRYCSGGRSRAAATTGCRVFDRKGVAGGDVGEAHHRVHQRELPRVVELEAGDPSASGEPRRSAKCRSWPRSTKVSGHRGHGLSERRIGDVVGRGFRPQQEVITDVLFDGAAAVIAADDRIREVEIFNERLELAAIPFVDLAAEDRSELRRLADGAVGIEQPFAKRIHCGAALEDQVVAVFDLGEKQPMLAGGVTSFGRMKNGVKARSHFCAQRSRSRGVSDRPTLADVPGHCR